jgi:hypothetical protein
MGRKGRRWGTPTPLQSSSHRQWDGRETKASESLIRAPCGSTEIGKLEAVFVPPGLVMQHGRLGSLINARLQRETYVMDLLNSALSADKIEPVRSSEPDRTPS